MLAAFFSEIKLTRLRQPGTLTWQDLESGQMRNEAKIHVIRLNETVKDIQDLDIAQQYEPAKRKGRLFKIANEAVKAYFGPRPGQKEYVSCLFLDTKWDKKVSKLMGGESRAHASTAVSRRSRRPSGS